MAIPLPPDPLCSGDTALSEPVVRSESLRISHVVASYVEAVAGHIKSSCGNEFFLLRATQDSPPQGPVEISPGLQHLFSLPDECVFEPLPQTQLAKAMIESLDSVAMQILLEALQGRASSAKDS